MKTKSKFTNRDSRKNDKIKKFMRDTFGEDGKEKMMTKKERQKCVITSRNKRQRIF